MRYANLVVLLVVTGCGTKGINHDLAPVLLRVEPERDTVVEVGAEGLSVFVVAEDPEGLAPDFHWVLADESLADAYPVFDGRGSQVDLPAYTEGELTCFVSDITTAVAVSWTLEVGE